MIPDHVGWLLTENRKQKNMSNFLPKNWLWLHKKFTGHLRELLEQYLTEKQNGYLQTGHLREVVACEKWSL